MIFVEGHTDADGNDNYNLQLSDRRAKSVMRYLLERGSVDVSRLKAKGFGESQPIADNKSEQGKQTNRRVEFRIVDKDGEAKDMTKEGFKKDDAAPAAPAAKADDADDANTDTDDDDLP
jgi:OOP family OmpA-OmpF porin